MLQVLPLSMEPRLTTAADGEQRRTTIGRLRLPLLETAVGRPLTHTTYPAPRPLLTLPLGTSPPIVSTTVLWNMALWNHQQTPPSVYLPNYFVALKKLIARWCGKFDEEEVVPSKAKEIGDQRPPTTNAMWIFTEIRV